MVGSETDRRTITPAPAKNRQRCSCCGNRITHVGLGGGVALMAACEWSARLWQRDPDAYYHLKDAKRVVI